MSVPIAFAAGVNEVRIIPQTNVGSVLPIPIVKNVMTKSSMERASANRAAPIIDGAIAGKVTVTKAVIGVAPRSLALSTVLPP